MRWIHLALQSVYPNTEFCVEYHDDTDDVVMTWGGESWVPFDYDADQVAAAHAVIVTEKAWEELRETRDKLLAETDWWATSDRTMTAEQTAYRQALRDLPANTTDPANPVWPTKP